MHRLKPANLGMTLCKNICQSTCAWVCVCVEGEGGTEEGGGGRRGGGHLEKFPKRDTSHRRSGGVALGFRGQASICLENDPESVENEASLASVIFFFHIVTIHRAVGGTRTDSTVNQTPRTLSYNSASDMKQETTWRD